MALGDISGGLVGGGRDIGSAHGSITVETSGLQQAGTVARQVGRDIAQAMEPAAQSIEAYERAVQSASQRGGLQEVARSIDNVRQSAQGAGPAITRLESAMQRLSTTFGRVRGGLSSVNEAVGSLRTEIAAVGAIGGILSAIGLGTAGSLEEARVQLRGMVGSEREAVALMEQLRQRAAATGQPFGDMLSVARQLLPVLEGNTEELANWIPLVQRVAVLNRQEGLAGAAFAIREAFVSGGTDLISLTERFNLSRVAMREALEETGGDFAAALDIVLTRMGITEQTTREMGQTFNASFRAARDAAVQLIAEGFTPFLGILTPVLQRTAEWLSQLRQTQPEVATLGSSIAAVAAVGAPTLLFLNQMAEALAKIQALSIASSLRSLLAALAAVAPIALAIGGGVTAGIGATREIGQRTGNEQLAQASLTDIIRIWRQSVFVSADMITKIIVIIGDGMGRALQVFTNGIADMVGAMGRFIVRIGQMIPDQLGGANLEEEGRALMEHADTIRISKGEVDAFTQGLAIARSQLLNWIGNLPLIGALRGPDVGKVGDKVAPATGGGGDRGFTADQRSAIVDWAQGVQQIERQAAEARLQATQQYEQQRTQVISSYEQTIVREAEDFGRQRARQNEQLGYQIAQIRADAAQREADWAQELAERVVEIRQSAVERELAAAADLASTIAGIRADAAAREAQWAADLGARIADMRADSARRIEQMEEDHAARMEKLQRDHRRSLLEAASRLDARAVAQEQRRFADQTTDMESDLQRRIAQERENLEVRIAQEQAAHARRVAAAREADERRIEQEQEAHAERLREAREADEKRIAEEEKAHAKRIQEAREADEKRISDMVTALRRQQAIEDEDRAIRLNRMAQDHQAQLAQLEAHHLQQLVEIEKQKVQERAAHNAAFLQRMADLGIYSQAWLELQYTKEVESLELWAEYWEQVQRIQSAMLLQQQRIQADINRGPDDPPLIGGYAAGGPVYGTGTAMLHGTRTRPEYVLSADTTDALRRMLRGPFTQDQLVSAVAGGGNRTAMINANFVIHESDRPEVTGREIRRHLITILRSVEGGVAVNGAY